MLDQRDLLAEANAYGMNIAKALNDGNVPQDLEKLQREWNEFIHSHNPRVQIILREQFYDGYYGTRTL